MNLYHSSTLKIENPDLEQSRDYLDFGRGLLDIIAGAGREKTQQIMIL